MSAIVPVSRVAPTVTEVKTGNAVLSTTVAGVGRLINWALGHSMVVVPAYCPGNTIVSGSSGVYNYRILPKYQAIQRCWCFTLNSTDGTAGAIVTITIGGVSSTFVVGSDADELNSFVVVENRSAQSATEETIAVTIAVSGKGAIVMQIGAWDMPRPALAIGGSDNGVDTETLAHRERIYDGTGRSIGGLVDGTIAALAACRRVLMQWALPATTSEALSVTDTSYANIFTGTTGTTIVLARKLYRASTTGTLTAKVYARTADTSDIGDVRFTTSSGGSGTINIPTGSHAAFAWHGAPLTFDADCEDLSETDGLPSSTFDTLTIEAKVTAAGDELYLASVSVWEA